MRYGTRNSSYDAGQDILHQLTTWRGLLTFSHALAILSTIYRLYRRKTKRQLWWDDFAASVSLVLDCLYFPTLWLRAGDSRGTQIATTWIAQTVYPLLIWCTRVSLSLSIARVFLPQQLTHRTSIWLAVLCGITGLAISVSTLIICVETARQWESAYPYQCPLSIPSVIYRVCLDLLADAALVAIPFWAFWHRLKLPPITRRLIKACFAASLLTFGACITTSVVLFGAYYSHSAVKRAETGFLATVMAHLMASISLLVCSLLVVVTSFYRFFRSEDPVRPIGDPQSTTEPETGTVEQQSRPESADRINDTTSSPQTSSPPTSSVIELTQFSDSDFAELTSPASSTHKIDTQHVESNKDLDDVHTNETA